MISPLVALNRVLRLCAPLPSQRLSLDNALGLVLAEDVRSRIALPPFDNSSMDGYAVRARDCARATVRRPVRLRIRGAIHAGDRRSRTLRAGEAIPVATGAPVPRGADGVLPMERVSVEGRELVVPTAVVRGACVRRRGEEVRPGDRVLPGGSVVHAGAVGCLAAVGRSHVRVVRMPRVTVITTGDEVVQPGRALAHGSVYDSNFPMLGALLRQAGITPGRIRHVRDDEPALERALADALVKSDVVITVGGVSVGPRDFVRGVLARLGVREEFWLVRQQPGKPLYFGRRGRRLVFGLPGNPASAFVCFCFYVLPALRALGGHAAAAPVLEYRALSSAVVADPHRWRLLRARAVDGSPPLIDVLPRQGSHMVTSRGYATHLVVLPPGAAGAKGKRVPAGTRVRCLCLAHAGDAPS